MGDNSCPSDDAPTVVEVVIAPDATPLTAAAKTSTICNSNNNSSATLTTTASPPSSIARHSWTNCNIKPFRPRAASSPRPIDEGTDGGLTTSLRALCVDDSEVASSQDDLEDEGCSMGLSSGCESSSCVSECGDLDDSEDSDESALKLDDGLGSGAASALGEPLTHVVINGKQLDMSSERYAVLSYDQVLRLDSVMDETMPIHGRGNFPTLEIKLKDLVQVVRAKLLAEGIVVRDIRLNGSAASYVLSSENPRHYTDLDLIFGVDLSDASHFERVRSAVLDSLLDFLPESVITKRMSSCMLKEAYVHKMVKVAEGGDRWSLISLCNHSGRDVELKFVDKMRRQFEFSVDSFQIILDSLLQFYECSSGSGNPGSRGSPVRMSRNLYPTVVGESVYGNFAEALSHLQRKVVATRNPEEIRGGGLLKYCRLLVKGYRASKLDEMKMLERYMCSRFFIDFSDLAVQRVKLEGYLQTHFQGDDQTKYDYLTILHRVVDESTVCLMGHERRQTLSLIEELAYHFYYQDQQRYLAKHQYGGGAALTSTGAATATTTFIVGHTHHPGHTSTHHFYYTPFHHPAAPAQPHYATNAHAHHHPVNSCYSCHCGGWMTCA